MDEVEPIHLLLALQNLRLLVLVMQAGAGAIGTFVHTLLEDDDQDTVERRKLIKSRPFGEGIARMDDKQFRRNFRIHYKTFEDITKLVYEVAIDMNQSSIVYLHGSGRRHTDITLQVLILIWYICHGKETLNSIAERFGVGEITVLRIRKRLCALVKRYIVPKLIKWPSSIAAVDRIRRGFRQLEGVMGAIDGTHIKIRPPTQYPEAYVNRKSFHSIQLQLISDSSLSLLDIYSGHPGSVHDAKVFRESPIGQTMLGNHPTWTPDMVCPGNTYLLGDAAYPLLPNLITPFRNVGPTVPDRERFNYVQSSCRMAVERTIGLLKGRCRRLMDGIDVCDLQEIEAVIFTACAIHQLALKCDNTTDINEFFNDVQDAHMQAGNEVNQGNQAGPDPVDVLGRQRRNELMTQLGLNVDNV